MKYLSLEKQLFKERRKNAVLNAEASKNKADIDYIAMMCNITLEMTEEVEDTEGFYEEV